MKLAELKLTDQILKKPKNLYLIEKDTILSKVKNKIKRL